MAALGDGFGLSWQRVQYGVEEGAKSGFARVHELLQRLPLGLEEVLRNG
jgi:hypothetical protein